MSSILIVKTSSLGDVVHMMPAVSDIRQTRPDAHITWLVDEAYVPIIKLHPSVDEVIPVAWRRWRRHLAKPAVWGEMRAFVARLRSRRFDAIIDTQGLVHSAMMARLAIGRRHGYGAASIREPLASVLYDIRHGVSRSLTAIERNRRLTAFALGYSFAEKVEYGLPTTFGRTDRAAPYAVFVCATSRPEKTWLLPSWLQVGKAIGIRGLDLVLTAGSAAEYEQATQMADALAGATALAMQPFERIFQLISGASLVVGLDTGLLHLAAALGVPTVAIFTGSDPALTGPVGQGPIAITGHKNKPPTVDEVLTATEAVMTGAVWISGVEGVDSGGKNHIHSDVTHSAMEYIGTVTPPAAETGY